jgi:hypothetical protein
MSALWPPRAGQRPTSGCQLCDGFRSQFQVTPGDSTRPRADIGLQPVWDPCCGDAVTCHGGNDPGSVPNNGHPVKANRKKAGTIGDLGQGFWQPTSSQAPL